MFRALSGGMAMLVAAIERRLPPDSVRLAAPALALARAASSEADWCVTTGDEQIRASAVIVAAPAPAAATLLADADPNVAALCREVPYASTASVALAWRRDAIDHPLAGSGFVVARGHNAARITACTWVSSKWEGRAPEGMALLRVFVGGVHDPQAVDLSDNELTEIAVRDMTPVLGIRTPPHFSRVSRWRAAGAQHNVGQLARMADIEARLARHPGLFVAGSGFRSVGIPDCIADGRAAANTASTYVTIGRGSGSQGAREPRAGGPGGRIQ